MEWTPGQLEARQDRSAVAELALLGGAPVRRRQWPKWPRADASTQRNLLDVLHSTKWTVSGQSDRSLSYERRFGQAFATYVGRRYGVACASGSAALTMALQVLNIGQGDEVLVPGVTWVACASAVHAVGATPVLVDVDPNSLTMSLEDAEKAVTTRSRALLMVHLYGSLAPVKSMQDLADRHGLALIEDASQAHGAQFEYGRAGSFGRISVFSMQQSKLLSAGEGGACLTDDPHLYRRLQQLRADGRIYADEMDNQASTSSVMDKWLREIVPCGEIAGRNLCMSEFHAAILLDRLNLLDAENQHRHSNFLSLTEMLRDRFGGDIAAVTGHTANLPTHYRVCLRLSDQMLLGLPIGEVARALSAELSLPVETIDSPLNVNPLYRPWMGDDVIQAPPSLPVAANMSRRCLTLPHWSLLGDSADIRDLSAALGKVLILRRDVLIRAISDNPTGWWRS